MRVLDLFGCEGVGGSGYARVGCEVIAVDLDENRLKYNPHPYVVGDALAILRTLIAGGSITDSSGDIWFLQDFDFIHASPPCQGYTRGNAGRVTDWPKLIPDVRALLDQTGLPYVIENVKDAGPDMLNPIALCGCMFDLSVRDYSCTASTREDVTDHLLSGACNVRDGITVHLQRLRLFEANWDLTAPRACDHSAHEWVAGAYGGARRDKHEAKYVRKGGYVPPKKGVIKTLLGVEHDVTWNGLFECIPPAYAEWIGRAVMAASGVETAIRGAA